MLVRYDVVCIVHYKPGWSVSLKKMQIDLWDWTDRGSENIVNFDNGDKNICDDGDKLTTYILSLIVVVVWVYFCFLLVVEYIKYALIVRLRNTWLSDLFNVDHWKCSIQLDVKDNVGFSWRENVFNDHNNSFLIY